MGFDREAVMALNEAARVRREKFAGLYAELDRLAGEYRQAEKDLARLMEEDHDSGPVPVRHIDMARDASNDAAHELAGFVAENIDALRAACSAPRPSP